MAVTPLQLVTELYIAYFNRAPDPAGLNAWIADLNAGATITQVANAFANSGEAKALYPFLNVSTIPDQASAAGFVTAVYGNLLNRAPEGTVADKTTGLGYWTDQLDTGKITTGQFILAVVQSVNAQTGTADAATLANKVTVADFYETTVATLNAQFSIAAATAAIAGVTNTTSVAAAEAAILATVARNTFTLTANTDIVTDLSGLGHDVVNAPLVIGILGAQTQSINVGDQITLSGDNNIANITLGSTIGSTSWPAGSVLNLGTGVANTFNVTNVGSILPVPGILPGLIPGNDIIGANIINDNNSVASVAILGVPGIIGTTGLMTVPTQVNMNNTTTTALLVQVDTTKLTGTESVALGVTGVGIVKPNVPAAEGSEGTLFGGLSVGSNVPGTPGFGTFNMKITGNNAVALGTNGAAAAPNLVVTGTGNLELASIATALVGLGDTGAQFKGIKTIDTTGVTGNVAISGAGGEIGGKAATELFGVNGFLSSVYAGGVGAIGKGDLGLTSVKMGNGNNFLDISENNLAKDIASGLTVAMGTGNNELVVDETTATAAAPLTFYTGVTTLGVANAGKFSVLPVVGTSAGIPDVYNLANLGVNSIALFGDGTMTGAIAITKAGDKFALDVGSADTGNHSIAVTSTTPGGAFTSTVSLGVVDADADPTAGPVGEFAKVGLLTLTGFGTDNIVSNGGPALAAGAHNHIGGIIATDATIAPITVAISGNAELHIDNNGGGDLLKTGIGVGAGAPGSVGFVPATGAIGPNFSLVEIGNGTFFTDTDTAIVRFDGSVNVVSMLAGTSGGLVMDSFNTANQGAIGVLETGGANAANFLAGSFGNDVITMGSGTVASAAGPLTSGTVITEGGGDTIKLGTHLAGDLVDLFVGFSAAHTNVPVYAGIAGTSVNAGFAGEGFWGRAPGGAAVNLLTAADAFATSADNTTVSGFNVATDAVEISEATFAAGGAYFGFTKAGGGGIPLGNAVFEAVGPGAHAGLAPFAGATVLELGAGGGNAGLIAPPVFANAAAVAAQLQSDAYHLQLSFTSAAAGNSWDMIIAYQNTAGNTVIADMNIVAKNTNANPDLGLDFSVHVSDMVTLTGVPLSTLAANNIHFVA